MEVDLDRPGIIQANLERIMTALARTGLADKLLDKIL